ncbi:MAG: nitroreductase family protein [Gammaproteobacteria bacterium]|nr:nitroreductase family protein [Gammaproteobacteria bacterium]
MDLDPKMCDELLGTTRSVRKRLDLTRTVPRRLIEECLDLAVQAPTGSNSQTWRWIVIDDPKIRGDLADLYRRHAQPYLHGAVSQADEGQTKRVFQSAIYLMDNLEKVPVHVIPCILGRVPQGANGAGLFASIYPAVWNFQLALRARGLGSCLTTLHLGSADEAAQILNIPDQVTQAALLPVAWTVGTQFRRANRPPVDTVTYWNKFEAH